MDNINHYTMFDSRKVSRKEKNVKKNYFLMLDFSMKNTTENKI